MNKNDRLLLLIALLVFLLIVLYVDVLVCYADTPVKDVPLWAHLFLDGR